MKNITLTTTADREVMVNWNNVDFAKDTQSHFGEVYVVPIHHDLSIGGSC
jgi:hypothetical protein